VTTDQGNPSNGERTVSTSIDSAGPMRPRSRWAWWRPRVIPLTLFVVGVGLAVFTAYRAQQPAPLTAAEAAFLTLASSFISIAAGATFARIGRADPTLARSAVRRLLNIGQAINDCTEQLGDKTHGGDAASIREAAISCEARMGMLRREVSAAVQDWNEVHPEALVEVLASVESVRGQVVDRD
jgi:hypothetical protein